MKPMRSVFISCALCLLIATVSSCSKGTDTDTDLTKDAVTAAESWLRLVDTGDYETSWQQSAAVFKSAVTAAGWQETLDAVRKPLGDLVSRNLRSAKFATSLPGAPDGEYVVIQFATEFTGKKSAIETVTPMKDADGVWRVSGYYIN